MQPTAKTERGPIATSGPSLLVCHRTRRFLQTKSIRFSPLAAAQPLTILSGPETLNASGSGRACRMARSRNASSLLALPDFPGIRPSRYVWCPRNSGRFQSLACPQCPRMPHGRHWPSSSTAGTSTPRRPRRGHPRSAPQGPCSRNAASRLPGPPCSPGAAPAHIPNGIAPGNRQSTRFPERKSAHARSPLLSASLRHHLGGL